MRRWSRYLRFPSPLCGGGWPPRQRGSGEGARAKAIATGAARAGPSSGPPVARPPGRPLSLPRCARLSLPRKGGRALARASLTPWHVVHPSPTRERGGLPCPALALTFLHACVMSYSPPRGPGSTRARDGGRSGEGLRSQEVPGSLPKPDGASRGTVRSGPARAPRAQTTLFSPGSAASAFPISPPPPAESRSGRAAPGARERLICREAALI